MPNPAVSKASEPFDRDAYQAFSKRAVGTTINSQTLLATDYLNHFNEVVMILDMVPDMPEMLEMAREWQPKSYKQHFEDSGFQEKALAIEAYDHVPPHFKKPFEETISTIDRLVPRVVEELEKLHAGKDTDRLRHIVRESSRTFHALIERAGGIINGGTRSVNQAGIDTLIERPFNR
ncbi:MAG: hypothetical protein RIB59_12460 [Rhodospirillales bacterium]